LASVEELIRNGSHRHGQDANVTLALLYEQRDERGISQQSDRIVRDDVLGGVVGARFT
jgi:hypothetical protein